MMDKSSFIKNSFKTLMLCGVFTNFGHTAANIKIPTGVTITNESLTLEGDLILTNDGSGKAGTFHSWDLNEGTSESTLTLQNGVLLSLGRSNVGGSNEQHGGIGTDNTINIVVDLATGDGVSGAGEARTTLEALTPVANYSKGAFPAVFDDRDAFQTWSDTNAIFLPNSPTNTLSVKTLQIKLPAISAGVTSGNAYAGLPEQNYHLIEFCPDGTNLSSALGAAKGTQVESSSTGATEYGGQLSDTIIATLKTKMEESYTLSNVDPLAAMSAVVSPLEGLGALIRANQNLFGFGNPGDELIALQALTPSAADALFFGMYGYHKTIYGTTLTPSTEDDSHYGTLSRARSNKFLEVNDSIEPYLSYLKLLKNRFQAGLATEDYIDDEGSLFSLTSARTHINSRKVTVNGYTVAYDDGDGSGPTAKDITYMESQVSNFSNYTNLVSLAFGAYDANGGINLESFDYAAGDPGTVRHYLGFLTRDETSGYVGAVFGGVLNTNVSVDLFVESNGFGSVINDADIDNANTAYVGGTLNKLTTYQLKAPLTGAGVLTLNRHSSESSGVATLDLEDHAVAALTISANTVATSGKTGETSGTIGALTINSSGKFVVTQNVTVTTLTTTPTV